MVEDAPQHALTNQLTSWVTKLVFCGAKKIKIIIIIIITQIITDTFGIELVITHSLYNLFYEICTLLCKNAIYLECTFSPVMSLKSSTIV